MTSGLPILTSDEYFSEWQINPQPLTCAISRALYTIQSNGLPPPIINIIVEYLRSNTQTLEIFGEYEWTVLFGKVSLAPSIPKNILTAISKDNFNKPNMILFYIPERIDSTPLTELKMISIAKKIPNLLNFPLEIEPFEYSVTHIDYESLYNSYSKMIRVSFPERKPSPAHWVLINKNPIKESAHGGSIRERASFRDFVIFSIAYYALRNKWLCEGHIIRCKDQITYKIGQLNGCCKQVNCNLAVEINYKENPGFIGCYMRYNNTEASNVRAIDDSDDEVVEQIVSV